MYLMGDLTMAVGAAAVSGLLTGVVYRFALARSLLDVPNERSSHRNPTPRGGGLGLLVAVVAVSLPAMVRPIQPALLAALAGVLLAGAVGWMDDHRSLGVRVRIAAHLCAAFSLLPLALSPTPVPAWLGAFAGAWWILWTVSAINVVNFMDGIDGLIGTQAVAFGAYAALLSPSGTTGHEAGLILAGAAAGFLVWNWTPARIFLGDVGSGALGICFVIVGILLMREGGFGLVTAYLPLYAIFLDATVTLARRYHRGEQVTSAHRQHLYQRLANGGWGHARVTLLYASVSLMSLPVAFLPPGRQTIGVAVYFVGVLVLGAYLDRQAPREAQG